MPRKKRITTEEFVEEDRPLDLEYERPDPGALRDMDTVDGVLRDLGDTGNGLLLKYYYASGPSTGGFMGDYTAPVPEKTLQDWFPAGIKFDVRIFVHGEYRDHRPVVIGPAPNTSGGTGGVAGGNSEILQFMKDRINSLEADVRASRNGGGGQPFSLEGMAVLLKTFADMQRPPADTPSDKLMDAIKLGVDLAKSGGDADSWKSIIGDVVKEAAPVAMAMLQQPRQAAGPVVPQVAAPAEGETMEMMLRGALAYLKKKADNGADPGLYLDLIIDNRDDPTYGELVKRVLTTEFDAFAAVDREILQPQYVEFFRHIYDGLRSEFGGSNPVATDPGGGDGNAPNARVNGKAGKGSK